VRHLVCRPSDGKWALSDESPLHPLQLAGDPHDGHSLVQLVQLVHLSWNEAGSDLAVVDSSGRISIYAISTAVNNLALQRPAILDPDDDGSQLVGMMWLNIDRSVETSLLFLFFSCRR
jgi:mediator of RNA polymerase II transcription subunit 16, fungi type